MPGARRDLGRRGVRRSGARAQRGRRWSRCGWARSRWRPGATEGGWAMAEDGRQPWKLQQRGQGAWRLGTRRRCENGASAEAGHQRGERRVGVDRAEHCTARSGAPTAADADTEPLPPSILRASVTTAAASLTTTIAAFAASAADSLVAALPVSTHSGEERAQVEGAGTGTGSRDVATRGADRPGRPEQRTARRARAASELRVVSDAATARSFTEASAAAASGAAAALVTTPHTAATATRRQSCRRQGGRWRGCRRRGCRRHGCRWRGCRRQASRRRGCRQQRCRRRGYRRQSCRRRGCMASCAAFRVLYLRI